MRLILALQCFFAVLFGKTIPVKALPPPPEAPDEAQRLRQDLAALQARVDALTRERDGLVSERDGLVSERDGLRQELDAAKAAVAEAGGLAVKVAELEVAVTEASQRADVARAERDVASEKLKQAREQGVLSLLAWLQREGRLIDFLREDIDGYDDEQVGAAVRAIHKGCQKVLEEGLELQRIMDGEEESRVEVPAGFDPVAIQLTGNVKGDPPFKGTLMHRGWRAASVSVPVPETVDPHVLAPAEVEL